MNDAEDLLTLWVIYWSPRDYPGKWVVRGQDARCDGSVRPHPDAHVVDSLKAARALVPWGSVNLRRFREDDPAIYETWV